MGLDTKLVPSVPLWILGILTLGMVGFHLIHVYVLIPQGLFLASWWQVIGQPLGQLTILVILILIIRYQQVKNWKPYVAMSLVAMLLTFPGIIRSMQFVETCALTRSTIRLYVMKDLVSESEGLYVSRGIGQIAYVGDIIEVNQSEYRSELPLTKVPADVQVCLDRSTQISQT